MSLKHKMAYEYALLISSHMPFLLSIFSLWPKIFSFWAQWSGRSLGLLLLL